MPRSGWEKKNQDRQEITIGLSRFIQYDDKADAGLRAVVTKIHKLPLYKSDRPATPILEAEITDFSRGIVFKSGFLPLGPIPEVGDVVEIIRINTEGGYGNDTGIVFARKLE